MPAREIMFGHACCQRFHVWPTAFSLRCATLHYARRLFSFARRAFDSTVSSVGFTRRSGLEVISCDSISDDEYFSHHSREGYGLGTPVFFNQTVVEIAQFTRMTDGRPRRVEKHVSYPRASMAGRGAPLGLATF